MLRQVGAATAAAALAVWPEGGQGTARRNALAAVAADERRAHERRVAATSLALAERPAGDTRRLVGTS